MLKFAHLLYHTSDFQSFISFIYVIIVHAISLVPLQRKNRNWYV